MVVNAIEPTRYREVVPTSCHVKVKLITTKPDISARPAAFCQLSLLT
jgi:hypothetical protein